ncbi:MAG TPA: hypothetical protein VHB21_04230 [Minicystis sp.]|nr:hypothetical protein [Minicystis sp.]
MRPKSRSRAGRRARFALAAAGFVAAALAAGVALPSCGTDAVGVDACRQIEDARCQASTACGFSAQEVSDCQLFYHDECLHGIENTTENMGAGPTQAEVTACVDAVKQLGACIQGGGQTFGDCKITISTSADPAVADHKACEVLQHEPEAIGACAFIVEPPEAGVPDTGIPDVVEEDAFIL